MCLPLLWPGFDSWTWRHVDCWVCCWFSVPLWEAFLLVLQFSSLLKHQHFQIPIWYWIQWTRNATLWMSITKTQPNPILITNTRFLQNSNSYWNNGTNVSFDGSRCNMSANEQLNSGVLGSGKMIQLNGQRLQLQKDLFDAVDPTLVSIRAEVLAAN